MTWVPLERVPEPLRLAFCDAVRATILNRDVGLDIRRDADGMLVVPVEGAAPARVRLDARSEAPVRFGARQALRVELDGRAVVGQVGYGLSASAVIDVKTRCFVSVTCDILWRDAVA